MYHSKYLVKVCELLGLHEVHEMRLVVTDVARSVVYVCVGVNGSSFLSDLSSSLNAACPWISPYHPYHNGAAAAAAAAAMAAAQLVSSANACLSVCLSVLNGLVRLYVNAGRSLCVMSCVQTLSMRV